MVYIIVNLMYMQFEVFLLSFISDDPFSAVVVLLL